MSPNVPTGCERLIQELDQAVLAGDGDSNAITKGVKEAMMRLCAEGCLTLPAEMCQPVPGSYARRLIHNSPEVGYTALAMVWGPGQGTPVHDHDGLWCVECVVQGELEITSYGLMEYSGSLYRFEQQETVQAGVGSAGRLIPPFDYHTIANSLPDQASVTVHVYGGEMNRCCIFEPRYRDWYERVSRELALTA